MEGSQHLRLAISLPFRNPQELTALLGGLYSPASPEYRKFLSPTDFSERFGPSEEDYQAVIAFARAHGLKVTGTHPNRMIVDVDGAVSDIEQSFHVKMQVYQHPREARQFYAPDTDPTVDAPVTVLGISGLDSYSIPRPNIVIKGPTQSMPAAGNAGSGPSGTYSGYDFRAAYAPGTSLTGFGQTLGLFELDGYTTDDITYYENQAGLPNVPLTNVLVDGFNGTPMGAETEVSLDIEMAISMAPGLTSVLVYEGGPNGNWHDVLNRMATDDTAKVISCSWYIPNAGVDAISDQIFQQMAAQGQSFFTASGDSDAYTGLIPYPCDSPYLTTVGGTTLTTTGPGGAWKAEQVWNWGGGTGGSGGISTVYAIPAWQKTVSMSQNQGSTTMRDVPDVAMTADNVYVRCDGLDQDVGGTSCAAPLWAGFAALINQQATTKDQTVGFVNPALYALGQGSSYTAEFNDIVTGNDFSPSSPTMFSAEAGYDLCTGWGTPTGTPLINALAGAPDSLGVSFLSFNATGPAGGPFLPNTQTYTVTNLGTSPITWTASSPLGWLALSSTTGTLAAGGQTSVIASLNPHAAGLASGYYSGVITFTDVTAGTTQVRPVSLNVPPQTPVLSVTPTTGFSMGGPPGGPFNPSAVTYLVSNAGESPMSWAVSNTSAWLIASPAGGILAAGGTTSVTATPTAAAYALASGTYNGMLAFANLDNGTGNVSVPAMLTVASPPAITSATRVVADQGLPFSFQILATNGATSYTAAPLPAGLSINPATGLISGTATTAGLVTAAITASNAGGTANGSLAINVVPEVPAITGSLAVTGTYQQAFSYQIEATNQPTTYSSSTPPGGLTLNSATGVISGTAMSIGTFNVLIGARNSAGNSPSAVLAITIAPIPTPVISCPVSTLVGFNFAGNGVYPAGALIQGADGNLYGTTEYGPDNYYGEVFKLSLSGSLTVITSFDGTNGQEPEAGLVQANDGNFYGTAPYGGLADLGTVFRLTESGSLTAVSSFAGTTADSPTCSLVQGTDGFLYGTTSFGGANSDGLVFKMSLSGSLVFTSSFNYTNGYDPAEAVVQASDTNFYGAAGEGGADGDGVIYKVTSAGVLTTVVSFNGTNGDDPVCALVQGTNGFLYGTTYYGGTAGDGTVFKVTTGGSLTTLCTFSGTNGANPDAGLMKGSDGNFYGTTYYGGASGYGTVFMMTTSGSLTTLFSFDGGDGAYPTASLTQASDGNIYGTTIDGGNAAGTIFKLTPFTVPATVGTPFSYQITASNTPTGYSAANLPAGLTFNAATGLISGTPTAAGTKVATISATNTGGTTNATLTINVALPLAPAFTSPLAVSTPENQLFVYQVTASGNPTSLTAASLPGWLSYNSATGVLSGTPLSTGTSTVLLSASNAAGLTSGTLTITVLPSAPVITSALCTVYAFNGANGANPAAGLVPCSDGNLYGTTESDSAAGNGTVFEIVSSSGTGATLGFLNGSGDGAYPDGALIQAQDGNLYGTAPSGGSAGEGTVFRLAPGGVPNVFTVFNYGNGADPLGALVQGSDGNFYGATEGGGSAGEGTAFRLSLTGSVTSLCSFTGSNGAEPMAGLVQASDGNLYGTALYGGTDNFGAVFRVTTSGSLSTVCSFTGTNGEEPISGLVQGMNGLLYGTTLYGGSFNAGTVFAVTMTGSLTTLCSFNNADGTEPFGTLMQGIDGNFYGTTSSGGLNNLGTIFEVTPGGALSTLYSFSGSADGSSPRGGLAPGPGGALYGTTFAGGPGGEGTVFAITPPYLTGSMGQALSYQITATNSPTAYNATGLPTGLNFNAATGLIYGTPNESGTFNVTLSATNAGGTGWGSLFLEVLGVPVITSGSNATAVVGGPFSYQIVATSNPSSYSATGLPGGLNFNSATGLITGTVNSSGNSNATIIASNALGSGSAALAVVIQTHYGAWQSYWFSAAQMANSAISGDNACPAGDGIPNLMKYALHLDPFTNGAGGLPVEGVTAIGGNEYVTLSYTEVTAATDIEYIPEVSGDLLTWAAGPNQLGLVSVTPNPGGLTETVVVRDMIPTTPGVPRFIRLWVIGP